VPKKTQRISDLQAKIALQIVEYIKDNDLEKGQHLTEEKFAALFGVSRTPVRATLNYLEKIGVLKVVANRGYFLAVTPGSINLGRLGIPMSEEEKLYSNVVRDIVRGHWKEEVTEIDLIRRYEVQRGLVTRVLWRLAKEGVVERSAGVGWTIQPILKPLWKVTASGFWSSRPAFWNRPMPRIFASLRNRANSMRNFCAKAHTRSAEPNFSKPTPPFMRCWPRCPATDFLRR